MLKAKSQQFKMLQSTLTQNQTRKLSESETMAQQMEPLMESGKEKEHASVFGNQVINQKMTGMASTG